MISFKQFICESSNITWGKPDFKEEWGEYFENSYTKRYFKKRGLVFKSDEELYDFLNSGTLTRITKQELSTKYTNLTLDDKDFDNEISDPEYRQSYDSMQNAKKLPAPIIVRFKDGTYFGFAGNRRTNTAFRKGIPLKVWLINANV